MLKKLFVSAGLVITLSVFVILSSGTTSYAQDTDPTPIPVLPETTNDSAAPLAPNVPLPPDVQVATPDSSDPIAEATQAVGEDVSAPEIAPTQSDVCPIGVQDSFTAVEILCSDVASGEACIGNGTVNATFGAEVASSFAQSNDRAQISNLDRIQLVSGTTWTVIRAELGLSTTDGGDIAQATVFAYGNLTLTDTGRVATGSVQNGTVIAERGMNVRRAPGNEGVVVWQLQGGQDIIVTGISADREWIRMVIPNEFAGTGWVYAPYISVEGGDETLAVVGVNSPVPDFSAPEFTPGQSYELLSELPSENCDSDVPISGLLVQSPSSTPDALRLQINNAEIQINGTVFIQAQVGEVLRISVLEGEATVLANNSDVSAQADNRINVPLDINLVVNGAPQAEAFDAAELANVPIRLLPRPIAFGFVFDEVATEENVADEEDNTATNQGFGTPQAQTAAQTAVCILTAPDEVRNIRAGASTEFDVVQVLQPNETVEADGQALGQLNLTWYRTVTGGWVRIDTINAAADCGSLPVVETPALPEPEASTDVSLSASALAPLVCDGSSITGSASSNGVETFITIGGTWTATAGTTASFNTQGGLLRPEFGAYIRLIADDGSEITNSGENRSLTVTFDTDVVFEARFSAANNDTVVMAVSCS
ncbi:MAG: SH3 domain-containing protein [Phototrophicaceae bacterium]